MAYMRRARGLLLASAIVFATCTLVYTALWIFDSRPEALPPVELGFNTKYVASDGAIAVLAVYKDSPAELAGLRAGDRIRAIDSRRTDSDSFLNDTVEAP